MRETRRLLLLIVLAAALAIPTAALAGGNGKGNNRDSGNASCVVEGNVVHATGLPDSLLNFMVADADGEYGWVLGHTYSGTWDVAVADRTSTTTYKFISRTKGKDGKRYTTYASCSAGA